jgi:UDP-N-acetylglucosamine 2-epimerase (non-hydrolysing)
LQSRKNTFDMRVCLTGQHREMLNQAVDYFEIPKHYDLKLMKPGQGLPQITAALVTQLNAVLEDFSPDLILVQGDTTSAFAGALSGFYRQMRVGHVEAGLRTDNKYAPFPEEMNRRLTGVLADYHFAPTEGARLALLREGIQSSAIVVTGNTVIDALKFTLAKIDRDPPPMGELEQILASNRKIILVTGHRRENFGEGFRNICDAIRSLAIEFPETEIVYPVHLNPNVQQPVYSILGGLANVHLVTPLSYVPFVRLMKSAHIILTDSGGIQEEAPTLGKPVLVMRESTERPEAVQAGSARLVGTDKDKIFSEAEKLIRHHSAWEAMSRVSNPFGDGQAASRIIDFLERCTFS